MVYLQISGIQHFTYCKRQWALAYMEQQWEDSVDTIIGQYIHRNADDPYFKEKRKGTLVVRSLPLISHQLGIRGIADIVLYNQHSEGIEIKYRSGKWLPLVIEYKKGREKNNLCDQLQLTAQIMCLEEMHQCKILQGALYYKTSNQRVYVEITDYLREKVIMALEEMRYWYDMKKLPKAERHTNCERCSVKDLCMPRMMTHKKSVRHYLELYLRE